MHRAVDKHRDHQRSAGRRRRGSQDHGCSRRRGVRPKKRAARQQRREAERRPRDEARRGPEFTEQVSKTLRLGRNGTFDLQNISGEIVVTGGGGNEVRVDATKRVRHPNESEARQLLQAIEVRIEERNGNVEVRTNYPRRNWSGGVDYTVAVPRDANVDPAERLGRHSRQQSERGSARRIDERRYHGQRVRRIRQAKTFSGDLEIVDSDGDDVVGSTISGTIMARGLKARSVDLQSVSGDLRLTDVESDRTFVRSVSGTSTSPAACRRPAATSSSRTPAMCELRHPARQGFSLEASTFSGDLRSDYPLTLQGNPPNNAARRNTRGIRGSFGEGGAVLTLQSFSGNITIVKR